MRRLLRDDVPLPVIAQTLEVPGATRVRELEGLGAFPHYAARLVPQVHVDVPHSALRGLARSRALSALWLDEPVYSMNHHMPPPVNPLRSSSADVKMRLAERLAQSGAPPAGNPHLRAYLGGQGPADVLTHQATVLGLDDVVAYTRSGELQESDDAMGRGVTVAVLDTGVDESHPMLAGAVTDHYSFVSENPGNDLNGHGTWCAGAIAGRPVGYDGRVKEKVGRTLRGMAPEASILDVKVLNGEGAGFTSGIVQGIEAAVAAGARILSLSLGSLVGQAGQNPDALAVNEATKRGHNCFVAAGNSFAYGTIGSPGSASGAITVASIGMKQPSPGATSSFSSKGPAGSGILKPDIAAPGGQIGARDPVNETILGPTSGIMAAESGESWALMRGTSMATPAMAGLAAQLVPLGFPADRERVEAVLAEGVQTRHAVKNIRVGWGIADAVRLRDAIHAGPIATSARRLIGAIARRPRPILGIAGNLASKVQRLPAGRADTLRIPLV